MERYVAIDNVCAWPNLTLMPDGTIIATVFNQPSHGRWEGDVECWGSTDGGRNWHLRGTPAPHEPGTNRLYVAAGVARDGALIVLASGFSHRPPPGQEPSAAMDAEARSLTPLVSRSYDGGRTWERSETVAALERDGMPIPFGNIQRCADGSLGVAFCASSAGATSAYFFRSRDDGRTWGEAVLIGVGDYSETPLLNLDGARWLAASRTQRDGHVELFVSEDDGQSWADHGALTLPLQVPANLLRLADGRILLSHGIRNRGLYGIGTRFSADEGKSWGPPTVLVDLADATDGGYPTSVQLEDGIIVTAYYANRVPAHQRYHMGVVRWRAD